MSDELFEVAFSGQIDDGADLDEVKAKVAAMFKADETKLAHLFSGKRIVIKKNIDAQTAAKYQTALGRVGAKCEVKSLSVSDEVAPSPSPQPGVVNSPPPSTPSEPAVEPASRSPAAASVQAATFESADHGDVLPPPLTDPLGITGDQIEDLSTTMAPVGSELQDETKQVAAPAIDVSDLEVAPVGSDIGSGKKQPDPPPPNTSGLSMAD
jgi:hypothetical protein